MRLFATAPAPVTSMLEAELVELGARRTRILGAGVEFGGDLALAYRACLWSRLASRILLPIARVPAVDPDTLYAGARDLEWEAHFEPHTTFAVDCSVRRARIAHSHFAALRVKDAVVDRFREVRGRRPDVDARNPDLRLHLHLRGGEGRIYLDLGGDSLHRRGYRTRAGPAPLRETLAAAMLRFAGWPEARFEALLDPLCGSGTLLIEAALMSADTAPGLGRERFGFEAWHGHDPQLWESLRREAVARRERGIAALPPLLGFDLDPGVLDAARANVARAGLTAHVRLEARDLSRLESAGPPAGSGLLVSNPPYGGRMGEEQAARCRRELERVAVGSFADWDLALLLPDDELWPARDQGRWLALTNGALPCRIHVLGPRRAARAQHVDRDGLGNRLRKNERRLAPWRRRAAVSCYRVYDADLPEFAFAVDLYEGATARWAHVQEYAPPPTVDPALAAARREAVVPVLCASLDLDPARVVLKSRRRQRGSHQYQHHGHTRHEFEVREAQARLLVNLHDYLDTGLFLDHRPVREWIHAHSKGLRFLNLFAYTGAASVHAALGGARTTVSVDLSPTYSAWARRNLERNGFQPPHHVTIQADCTRWLSGDDARARAPFDLVFLDPPTFSNSKRMAASFDVQRDHVSLVRDALAITAARATVVLSSNRRGFRLERGLLEDMGLQVEDWTRPSIPPDFSRPRDAHRCFILRRR
jgi:23S rRNA (guanine2445-N2)-methyltransferase / 23S rRNA (guanine2069-N7)-methyltransferase